MKVLVIEDDAEVAEAVSICLQVRWPEVAVSIALEGTEGVELLQADSFDIVILDLNLPDIDGFEALRQVRVFSKVPIIILTVRGGERDQAMGLEIGADDYIIKPFTPRNLVARVNAVLRRTSISEVMVKEPSIVRGRLILNLPSNEVQLGETTIKLTTNECKLLYILMDDVDHTFSTEEISEAMWGKEHPHADTIKTYIQRIRNKLNDRPSRIILNQHGSGYRFISPT
ncbi:response regulator transcription factor [Chloroflexota bacterium]